MDERVTKKRHAVSETELVSYSPVTGEEVWRGPHDNVEEAVSASRRKCAVSRWFFRGGVLRGRRVTIGRRSSGTP